MMNAWGACPKCLTLGPAGRALCAHCHTPLDWVERAAEFHGALKCGNAAWVPTLRLLCIRADGDGQPVKRDVPVAVCADEWTELLLIEGKPPLRMRLVVAEGRLELDGFSGSIPLPGECGCDGWHVRARLVAEPRHELCPLPITHDDGRSVQVRNAPGAVRLGRDSSHPNRDVVLGGAGVDFHHAVVVHEANHDHCWLADAGSKTGTFVNGLPIVARPLENGDLVQVADYAWTFDGRRGVLVPAGGVDGMAIQFEGAFVRGRLEPLTLRIEPRELVAIVGPSGAGKSTFIKVLIGEPGLLDAGRVLADDHDVADDPDGFRGRLGYVPQDRALHIDLTPGEVVQYSASFRGVDVDPKQLFRLVDLEDVLRDDGSGPLVGELSGGQEKRVRIAAELVTTPGLLVLDEPGSGLDPARETDVLRLLARLRDRGCTVVVVTHNLGSLASFSRVLVLRDRRLVWDGPPNDLLAHAPSGDMAQLDLRGLEPNVSRSEVDAPPAKLRFTKQGPRRAWFPQTLQLARRELSLLAGRRIRWRPKLPDVLLRRLDELSIDSRLRRRFGNDGTGFEIYECVLSLFVVPGCFALALHFAVKPSDFATLGFLAILSSIWMGASLALMSIVNEREVFDHERLLFLRVGAYVTAKTLVLYCLALVQTLLFDVVLSWLRAGTNAQGMFYGGMWSIAYLPLVGCAGTGMGLLISAVSRRSKPAANFILPLAIIAQIVFSVQVALDQRFSFHEAYGQFSLHACQRAEVHPSGRRAELWRAADAKTPNQDTPAMVADAQTRLGTPSSDTQVSTTMTVPGWYCNECDDPRDRRRAPPRSDGKRRSWITKDRNGNAGCPNLAATWCSYFTISRYADIALRTFAYKLNDAKAFLGTAEQRSDGRLTDQEQFGYRRWRREATAVLVFFAVGLPLATVVVLTWQSDPRWRAAPRRLLAVVGRRAKAAALRRSGDR